MGFEKLKERQINVYDEITSAVDTIDRARISRHEAETELRFVEATEALNHGDPWLLGQPEQAQAFYRASHANRKSAALDKLTQAMRMESEMEKLLHWLDELDDLEAFDE